MSERTEKEVRKLCALAAKACEERKVTLRLRKITFLDAMEWDWSTRGPAAEGRVLPVPGTNLTEWEVWIAKHDHEWLVRHELAHIADTLDPEFGWDEQDWCTRQCELGGLFLRWTELFGCVWGININARLEAEGYEPCSDSKADSVSDMERGAEVEERMRVTRLVPYREIAEATDQLWAELYPQ